MLAALSSNLILNVVLTFFCHCRDFGSLTKENVYENNRLVSHVYNYVLCTRCSVLNDVILKPESFLNP